MEVHTKINNQIKTGCKIMQKCICWEVVISENMNTACANLSHQLVAQILNKENEQPPKIVARRMI